MLALHYLVRGRRSLRKSQTPSNKSSLGTVMIMFHDDRIRWQLNRMPPNLMIPPAKSLLLSTASPTWYQIGYYQLFPTQLSWRIFLLLLWFMRVKEPHISHCYQISPHALRDCTLHLYQFSGIKIQQTFDLFECRIQSGIFYLTETIDSLKAD